MTTPDTNDTLQVILAPWVESWLEHHDPKSAFHIDLYNTSAAIDICNEGRQILTFYCCQDHVNICGWGLHDPPIGHVSYADPELFDHMAACLRVVITMGTELLDEHWQYGE